MKADPVAHRHHAWTSISNACLDQRRPTTHVSKCSTDSARMVASSKQPKSFSEGIKSSLNDTRSASVCRGLCRKVTCAIVLHQTEVVISKLPLFSDSLSYLTKYTAKLRIALNNNKSRDSVVGIATSYGLDDGGVGVPAPVGSRTFSSPDRPDRL
jgi:hypothetical protein